MNPARRTLDPRAKLYLLLVANLMLFFHVGLATQIVMVVLFLLPLLGGSLGALLGMRAFHHKTKHWYFVWGIPAILLAQIALAVWIYTK